MHETQRRHVKDALVHVTVLTLLLWSHARADPLRVKVPEARLAAARGHSVVLGCEFSPAFGPNSNISSLFLTWQRKEDSRVVHSFYFNKDQLDQQNSAYVNRTSLFLSKLSKGNASVRIQNVGIDDAGRYLCIVSTSQGTAQAELQLDYGAFYTEPKLTISVRPSGILVQYETDGFPEADVIWKGEHGENLKHVNTSVQSNREKGLYYIHSSYVAPNAPLNFTFVLNNQLLHQHLQRSVSYAGGPSFTCFKETIALAVVSLILALMAVITAWLYCHKKK